MMPLIIHSDSTKIYAEKIAEEYKESKIINVSKIKKPEPVKDVDVIGIGGGKVIDYAKIIAGKNRALVIPTTAAGAAATRHAVFWDKETKRKIDIKTELPIIRIESSFLESLSKDMIQETSYDALAHSLDSYWSKRATITSKKIARKAHEIIANQIENDYENVVDLVRAGNIAGTAIDITGTNITHAISYPITALYGISHGLAVGWAIHPSAEYQKCDLKIPNFEVNFEGINIDKKFIETISKEAMTYSKIHDAKRDITEERLIELLENKI